LRTSPQHPDYEWLNKGVEGAKRKRVVSVLSRQAAKMVKEDERILKKRKSSPEPKVTEEEKETPSTPPTAEVAEILKVMTESLPIKLLSPLGPELTKLFQKKEEPSATKKADGLKKRRISNVMQAIEKTPPPASASKIAPTTSAEVTPEANTPAKAAAATEPANLEATLSGIDKTILGMPAPVPDKGKEIAEAASKEKGFDLRNLVGQELSEAKKKELQEYGISYGY
jgi:hypothetical protein